MENEKASEFSENATNLNGTIDTDSNYGPSDASNSLSILDRIGITFISSLLFGIIATGFEFVYYNWEKETRLVIIPKITPYKDRVKRVRKPRQL